MDTTTTQTPGDRIAAEFSRDKVHLSDADQRRLAGMIDARFGPLLAAAKFAVGEMEGQYDGAPDSFLLWVGEPMDRLRAAIDAAEGGVI